VADDDDANAPEPDDLWTVAPAQFVEERNRVVRALRAGGDRAQAKEVASWRKPSVADWALNLAAREAPDAVSSFVEAARTAVGAQEAATSRSTASGKPSLREALAEVRRAETALVAAAVAQAKPAGGDHRAAIATRLRELAGQASLVDQLASGRLGAPLAEVSDDGEPDEAAAPGRAAAKSKTVPSKAAAPKSREDGREARAAAAKAHREAAAAATKAHREAAAAAKAMGQAEDRAGQALAALRSAKAEVDRLDAELAAAKTRLDRAEITASEAESALEDARTRAADADDTAADADRAVEAAASSASQ
jgi:chromosome segregation ATPase